MTQPVSKQKPLQIIVPLLAILGVIVVSVAWTIPRVRGWLAVQSQIDTEEDKLNNELIPKRNTLQQSQLEEVQLVLDTAEEVVPTDEHPTYLLALLEELIKVSEISVGRPTYVPYGDEATKSLFISADIQGVPQQVGVFLDYLFSAMPMLRVTRWIGGFEIDEDTGQEVFKATIEVESPVSPLPEEIVTGTQPIVPVLSDQKTLIEELEQLNPFLDPIAVFENPDLQRGKADPFDE
jgi:hypothetical protein